MTPVTSDSIYKTNYTGTTRRSQHAVMRMKLAKKKPDPVGEDARQPRLTCALSRRHNREQERACDDART